jgi:UDP-N-acetyl-D-galactosamine dehydrogenase
VLGFDINRQRLEELQPAELLEFTADPADLAVADVFIVTVPTPIDRANRPDLTPLEKASATVSRALKARAAQGATSLPN